MSDDLPYKLGIQQRVLPAYRAAFFDLLASECQNGLSIFAGLPRPEESLGAMGELQVARLGLAENLHLGRGRLYACVQKNLMTWLEDWNPDDVNDRVLQSQRRRLLLRAEAKRKGKFPAWTYVAREGDAERFVRSTTHGGAVGAKPRSRFPFVSPTPPELPPREN